MPSKKTKAETLCKKREAEKLRYEKICNDPVLWALQQEKERARYRKKIEQGTVKLVANLTESEHRVKKKEWRVNSKKYCHKKKEKEDNLPPRQKQLAKKKKQRDSLLSKKVAQMKKKIETLEQKVDKLRKREERRVKRASEEQAGHNLSPGKKTAQLLKDGNEKTIAKKLLFAETISQSLVSGYKDLQREHDKRIVKLLLMKNIKLLWKYKLVGECNLISSNMFSKSNFMRVTRDKQIRKFNSAVRSHIIQFFERDDVSKMMPGKKDYKTVKKVRKQKRLLLGTMIELFKKFCESDRTYKITYSTFCKMRPFWVVPPSITNRDTRACKIHANIKLLVTALHKAGVVEKNNVKDMCAFMCCNINSVACLQRSCGACKNSQMVYSEFTEDKLIVYEKWVTSKEEVRVKGKVKMVPHTLKKEVHTSLAAAVTNFEKEMLQYMYHQGVYIHQFRAVDQLKHALKENEVIVHCDFSENYAAKYSTEIQSFHFGGSRRQFTIHTVMVYYKKDCYAELISKSICTLSECNKHSAASAWAHLQPVFEFIKRACPKIETIYFASDAPSTQYQNKTLFYLLARALKPVLPSVKTVTWNYSAPGHGKSAPDGLGGTLKRTADDLVTRGVDIGNFDNFVATLQASIRTIQLHVIDEKEIESVKSLLPAMMPSFQGTMKVYQVIYSEKSPNVLTMKSLSCLKCLDCEKFKIVTLVYKDVDEMVTEVDLPVEPFLEVQLSEKDSTEEHPSNQLFPENEKPEECPQPQKAPSIIDDAVLVPDTYLLVKFDSAENKKKTTYQYVCRILPPNESCDLTVQGLRSLTDSKRKFIIKVNDICSINKDDIVCILPRPKFEIVKRKEIVIFPINIDINEK